MLNIAVPADTCSNPVRVPREDGYIFVGCGDCPACRRSKHSKWQNRISHAIKTHPASLFLTLTYSNEHLPIVTLDPDTMRVVSVTRTKFRRGNSNEYYRDDVLDELLKKDATFDTAFCDCSLDDLPHFVIHRDANKNPTFDTQPRFAIALYMDFQDFIKRLRRTLERLPEAVGHDISFTYFVCSEYGPDTFRPHFHSILFFHDPYISSLCHSHLIHDVWRKSNLTENAREREVEPITVGEGAAYYVSKYVTCDTDLPSFLRHNLTCPLWRSSHSEPIGSTALPLTSLSHTVRETDLLYSRTFKDKDTNEFVTVRLPYPPSFWSRYFPKFLFMGFISPSLFAQLIHRIFELDCNSPAPNLIQELNDKYHIGSFELVENIHPLYTYCKVPDPVISGLSYIVPDGYRLFETINNGHRITYSDIIHDLYNSGNFVDLFLFGIPQNRCAVNKILRLRRALLRCSCSNFKSSDDLPATDNWCSSADDYIYHYNLFYTKSFTNTLRTFYEHFERCYPHPNFTPSLIAEYYPSFYSQLPKEINAFNETDFQIVQDILHYGYNLTVENFYDNDGKLIAYDFRSLPHYYVFRWYIRNYYKNFETKRKEYYNKYGCGENTS